MKNWQLVDREDNPDADRLVVVHRPKIHYLSSILRDLRTMEARI